MLDNKGGLLEDIATGFSHRAERGFQLRATEIHPFMGNHRSLLLHKLNSKNLMDWER